MNGDGEQREKRRCSRKEQSLHHLTVKCTEKSDSLILIISAHRSSSKRFLVHFIFVHRYVRRLFVDLLFSKLLWLCSSFIFMMILMTINCLMKASERSSMHGYWQKKIIECIALFDGVYEPSLKVARQNTNVAIKQWNGIAAAFWIFRVPLCASVRLFCLFWRLVLSVMALQHCLAAQQKQQRTHTREMTQRKSLQRTQNLHGEKTQNKNSHHSRFKQLIFWKKKKQKHTRTQRIAFNELISAKDMLASKWAMAKEERRNESEKCSDQNEKCVRIHFYPLFCSSCHSFYCYCYCNCNCHYRYSLSYGLLLLLLLLRLFFYVIHIKFYYRHSFPFHHL